MPVSELFFHHHPPTAHPPKFRVFPSCAQGDPHNPASVVEKSVVHQHLLELYDLEIDSEVLGGKGEQLTKEDFETLLITTKA